MPTSYTRGQYAIYAAAVSSNTAGFFWLDLTGSSPATTRIGSFSVTIPSGDTAQSLICQGYPLQPNKTQPQTLAAVVAVLASGSGCTASGATYNYYLIDHASSTVTQISGLTRIGWADGLYDQSSGVLTDIIFFDAGSGKLGVYPYTAGTNPFATSATYVSGTFSAATNLRSSPVHASTYVAVTPATGSATQSIYKFIGGSTTAQPGIYTEPGPGTIDTGTGFTNPKSAEEDGTNVYFVDSVSGGAQYLVEILGANDTYKYLYTNSSPGTTPMSVLGADGTKVLMSLEASGGTSNSTTWNLYSVAAGTTTTSLPSASYTFTGATTFSLPTVTTQLATPGSAASTLIFLNVIQAINNGASTQKFSAILNPSGTLTANTNYNLNTWLLPDSVGDTGTVLQIRNISDAQASFIGGATSSINKIVLSGILSGNGDYSSASTILKSPSNAAVPVPSGDVYIDFIAQPGSSVVGGASLPSGEAFICTLSINQVVVLTPAANTWLIPY